MVAAAKSPDDVVVASAVRTTVGKFLGVHKKRTAVELGTAALVAALERHAGDG